MDATIIYDTIIGLLANPPSLGYRPNFFNLRALRTHLAHALRKVSCPQPEPKNSLKTRESPLESILHGTRSCRIDIT